MSSGFISGGTDEQPAQRNELWIKAEQELEASRRNKEEQKNHDGKSLYEVLQANKAAKQEAFEESIKLKHQFRSLDEDDVDFLNSVREADRAKQEVLHRETSEQLEAFRRQQQRQDAAEEADADVPEEARSSDQIKGVSVEQRSQQRHVDWKAALKKRKRQKEDKNVKGIKMAKHARPDVASAQQAEPSNASPPPPGFPINESDKVLDQASGGNDATEPFDRNDAKSKADTGSLPSVPSHQIAKSTVGLGLTGYSSDDSDE